MKKIFNIICVLIAVNNYSYAQQNKIDSLSALLKSAKEDTNKVNILFQLDSIWMKLSFDTAINISGQSLALSEKLNWRKGAWTSYHQLGSWYYLKGDFIPSLSNYEKALAICDLRESAIKIESPLNDRLYWKARTFNNAGLVYYNLGNYAKALANHLNSLNIKEKIGAEVTGDNINIGNVYNAQSEFSKALVYYFKALKTAKEIKYQLICLGNIGVIYFKQQNYNEALDYYSKSLELAYSTGDKNLIGQRLNNIAVVYQAQKQYKTALDSLMKALALAEEIQSNDNRAAFMGSIGSVYIETKNYPLAKKYISEALQVSKDIGALNYIWQNENYLSKLYEETGGYKESLEHLNNAIAIKDSLFTIEKNDAINTKVMNYEFDKKQAGLKAEQEKKDFIAKEEIEKQKSLRNNIVTGGGIFILASIISFIFYRRKREAQMQADLSTARVKTMTAQIEKHFVFGSFSSVKNLIDENPQKASELITRSSKFLRATLNLSESTTISLKEEIDASENFLQVEKMYHDDKFDFEFLVASNVDSENILVPPLIIQPIVENSIKHGFSCIDYKGKITIEINTSSHQLICKIADNGAGLKPKAAKEHKSFGTRLTRERLELFNKLHKQKAEFKMEPLKQGVMVTLYLPLKLS